MATPEIVSQAVGLPTTRELILGGQLLTILFFIIIGFIIFMVATKYNIKVLIYEQTGMGTKLTFKKAKRVEKISGNKLQFLFSKQVMALPSGQYFFPLSKKSYFISLYKDKAGNYHPMQLRWTENKNPLFVPDDADMRFWLTNHLKEAEATYKSEQFWAKYAPVVVLGATIAFAALILIIYGKFYFDGINSAAQSVGSNIGKLEQTLRTIGGVGGGA